MPAPTAPRVSVREPSPGAAEAFARASSDRGGAFSYPDVGSTRALVQPPAGYNLDHNRQRLGAGEAVFVAACAALRAWRMFPAPWTAISPAAAPIEPGRTLAMRARALGLWWLNACRIVYVIDERAPIRRFGFAYGTLAAHVEAGEERFLVELHPDGDVWYDLLAFSRPRYWPVRLAKPLARGLQARFARESKAAMAAACRRPEGRA